MVHAPSLFLLSALTGATHALPTGIRTSQQPLTGDAAERARWRAACPRYEHYAANPHPPLSEGPLQLPFQRPAKQCRTFASPAVEEVIIDITGRMSDPDLARIFENAFPNTLDTTVSWHDPVGTEDQPIPAPKRRSTFHVRPPVEDRWKATGPQSFIVTGDITAEWLRDSTNQLQAYHSLAPKDPALKTLIQGAIATQAEYVIEAPYCNAFQPPPGSGLPKSQNGLLDDVHPIFEPDAVFECKYELDSLAHFLKLANEYYRHTLDNNFVTPRWLKAVDTLMEVVEQQSQPTFNSTNGKHLRNEYSFMRETKLATETLSLKGYGNPINNGTGLIRSAFRPSDDATIFPFFIPANAMLVVELERTASVPGLSPEVANQMRSRASSIREGIQEHGIVRHKIWGEVYAFEVDGYGSHLLMDDANVPSLLSLPMLGFVKADDPVYQNTRKMILSQSGNPYYLSGSALSGIGGPHIGLDNAWPMSLLVQALTSDDEVEIKSCLETVKKVSPLGLVHESVRVDSSKSHTREWFAWANSVFAQTVLDLAERKPHLVYGNGQREGKWSVGDVIGGEIGAEKNAQSASSQSAS